MWKKLDNPVRTPIEPDSDQTQTDNADAVGEMLLGVYLDSKTEKAKSATLGQTDMASAAERQPTAERQQPSPEQQQSSPVTIATYTEAVNNFTRSVNTFIGYLPLLTEAREAYEKSLQASTELRKVLDSGDANIRSLMAQLEQMLNLQVIGSAGEKKKPESSKVEPIRGDGEASGQPKLQRLP